MSLRLSILSVSESPQAGLTSSKLTSSSIHPACLIHCVEHKQIQTPTQHPIIAIDRKPD